MKKNYTSGVGKSRTIFHILKVAPIQIFWIISIASCACLFLHTKQNLFSITACSRHSSMALFPFALMICFAELEGSALNFLKIKNAINHSIIILAFFLLSTGMVFYLVSLTSNRYLTNEAEKHSVLPAAYDCIIEAEGIVPKHSAWDHNPDASGESPSVKDCYALYNYVKQNPSKGNGIFLFINTHKAFGILQEQTDTSIITAENSELPSNKVNTLYIDSSLTVWIGTDSGLSRLSENGWKHYDTILLHSTVNDLAYELTEYGKELWVATDSGLTVASFNPVDGITGSTTYTPGNCNIKGHKVSAVSVDQLHNRWVGTDSALCVFRGRNWDTATSSEDANGNLFFFYENIITDIETYGPDTMALIATNGKGIARMQYDIVDGFTGASTYGQPWASLTSDTISAIDVDNELQWYGTDIGAYMHKSNLTKDGWSFYNMNSGLVSNTIKTVHIDNNRYAWIGSSSGISIVLSDGGIYELTENEGLVNNNVNCITGDIEGKTWIGTSGGIQWYEGLSGNQIKLGEPKLILPENFTTKVDLSTNLQWTSVIGANSYSLIVATDKDFANKVIDKDILSDTSYQLSGLYPATIYYWKVFASNPSLDGYYSPSSQFTTRPSTSTQSPYAIRNQVNIYPNPARDMVKITFAPDLAQMVCISIYSLKGNLISTPANINTLSEGQTTIIDVANRSMYPEGVYVVRIQGETFCQVFKLNIN